MADVTVKYKNNVIAELNVSTTSKTLKTSGKYCEGDIEVSYTPPVVNTNVKRYNITLAKSSDWVMLIELDEEVLAHINDSTFTALLAIDDSYAYEFYSGSFYVVSNTSFGIYNGTYPVYGYANRQQSETNFGMTPIYYPANNDDTDVSIGGYGAFRVDSGKYYMKPSDGFIRGGNYKLIFTW